VDLARAGSDQVGPVQVGSEREDSARVVSVKISEPADLAAEMLLLTVVVPVDSAARDWAAAMGRLATWALVARRQLEVS